MQRLTALLVCLCCLAPTAGAQAAHGRSGSWPVVWKQYPLTHGGISMLEDVSPDGQWVLYARADPRKWVFPGSLWMAHRDGTHRRELAARGAEVAFFDPTGRYVFYSPGTTLLHRLDLRRQTPARTLNLRTIPHLLLGGTPEAPHPRWLPGRRFAFVRNRHYMTLDPFTGKIALLSRVQLPPLMGHDSGQQWLVSAETGDEQGWLSPDGRYITFPGPHRSTLLVWNARTARVIRRVSLPTHLRETTGDWWPDSRSQFFSDPRTGDSYILDVRTGRFARFTRVPSFAYSEVSWSPDRTVLAYVPIVTGTCVGNDQMLYFIRRDGTGFHPFGDPTKPVAELSAMWTPDGKAIVYTRAYQKPVCGSVTYDVWVADLR